MKKLLFLIPLVILSCKKDAVVSENSATEDSVQIVEKPKPEVDSAAIRDSIIRNSAAGKKVLNEGIMRDDEGNQIIRVADAAQLPFSLGDEFTADNQTLIVKIKNFKNPKISAAVTSKNKDMNIRINQIKLPNGDYDGPFGRELKDYEVSENGEVWLMIGKSNMASGEAKGDFTISVK